MQIQLKYSLSYLKSALSLIFAVIQAQGPVLIVQEPTTFSNNFIKVLKQTQQPLAFRP